MRSIQVYCSPIFHVTSSDYQQRFNPTCALAYLKVKVHFEASTLESIKRHLLPNFLS